MLRVFWYCYCGRVCTKRTVDGGWGNRQWVRGQSCATLTHDALSHFYTVYACGSHTIMLLTLRCRDSLVNSNSHLEPPAATVASDYKLEVLYGFEQTSADDVMEPHLQSHLLASTLQHGDVAYYSSK